MIKYGKSMRDILGIKQDFFVENDINLAERNSVRDIYLEQPKRKKCLLCGGKLSDQNTFSSHGIIYYVCPKCGHIQGVNLETSDFAEKLYIQSDYGKEYKEIDLSSYYERINKIYVPKADFLIESLGNEKKVLDIGAGSGYFVMASINKGVDITGIEISQKQVDLGNKMLESIGHFDRLKCISQDGLIDELKTTSREIISAIGVLEHLTNLNEVLEVISNNQNIKYLYFSVPMMSVSVLLESITPNIFNRHLGGAHTHVFTNQSIEYLCKTYDWTIKDMWRFGTDMMDVYRALSVFLADNQYLVSCVNENVELFDDIQLLLDKHGLSSEIHMIIEKK